MVVDRIGDATYRLRLINRLDNHYLTDIPAFDVTFSTGSYTQTVQFKGSEAIATFDVSTAITTVTAKISTEIKKSVSWNIEITEGYKSSNRESDPGYEAGEAINNPDPVIPTIDEYIRAHSRNGNGQGTGTGSGNGQGTGTGNGQGSGNGYGSSGHGGSNINGREGEIEGDISTVKSNTGTSPSIGVESAASGDSESVEGGSQDGQQLDNSKAYEVTKVINNLNENNWQFVLAVILFVVIVIFGYAYRRGKDDGDEF